MDRSSDIYRLFLAHAKKVDEWNRTVTRMVLRRVFDKGAVAPCCFMLTYDFASHSYGTSVMEMEVDMLMSESKLADIYTIAERVEQFAGSGTILAMKFVAEGIAEIMESSDVTSFLLITFETPLAGLKELYTLDKTSYVGPDGMPVWRVTAINYDREVSQNKAILVLEKFAHIMRPNWSNPHHWCYN